MIRENQVIRDMSNVIAKPRKNSRWIAVGDASRFLVFRRKRTGNLALVKSFLNAAAHAKGSELVTD